MYILGPKMDKSLPFEKVQPQFFSESVVTILKRCNALWIYNALYVYMFHIFSVTDKPSYM